MPMGDIERDEGHRARLLEETIHKVLDERGNGMKNGDSVAVGYGKWWAKIKGERLMAVFVILVVVAVNCYLIYQHDTETKSANAKIESAIHESNEIQQALLWVSSLSDADRAKLNLARPKKITEMQR